MRTTKARWKRAPIEQRRVASERTTPRARFTRYQRSRRQVSGSLPPSLPSERSRRNSRRGLTVAVVVILMVMLGVMLVITVGVVTRAQQQYEDMQWRAGYYGRPTQPFSTLAPDVGYPALAAPDDPRWTHGSATPLGVGFELRAVPTAANNDPLQTITLSTPCDFIVETDWGTWAQVRIGDMTAWVDTNMVELEAGS